MANNDGFKLFVNDNIDKLRETILLNELFFTSQKDNVFEKDEKFSKADAEFANATTTGEEEHKVG